MLPTNATIKGVRRLAFLVAISEGVKAIKDDSHTNATNCTLGVKDYQKNGL